MIIRASSARCGGFTLLEFLLALALSALLLSIVALASGTVSTQWDKQEEMLKGDMELALYLLRLERSLQGMFPYVYYQEGESQARLLIEAGSEKLIWASTLSPSRGGVLNVWRLRQDEDGILLDRAPLAGGFDEESMHWGQVERLESFAALRIEYAYYSQVDNTLQWLEEWPPEEEGERARELPRGVRLAFFREDQVVETGPGDLEVLATIKTYLPVGAEL